MWSIRFPDKLILQGTFHPRNTIADVRDWLLGCLSDDWRNYCEAARCASRVDGFVLFTSPPFRQLGASASLAELALVPAAIVNLQWTEEIMHLLSSRVVAAEDEITPSIGFYLHESVISEADSKSSNDGVRERSIPVGIDLIPKPPESSSRRDIVILAGGGSNALGDVAEGKSAASTKALPKWFKR